MPTRATLKNISKKDGREIPVLFNPTEYGIDRGSHFAELQVPGLEVPILQFVRGEGQTLTLELFLDRTKDGETVEDKLQELRTFVTIDPDLHAPPVCLFSWGTVGSPPAKPQEGEGSAKAPGFEGVVTSLKERFTLFDEEGRVLRARVTLTLKAFKPADVQLTEIRRSSPDRTRVRVLREGETLTRLATEAYGDPALWRVIAEASGIDRPRFVRPGTVLRLPSVGTGLT